MMVEKRGVAAAKLPHAFIGRSARSSAQTPVRPIILLQTYILYILYTICYVHVLCMRVLRMRVRIYMYRFI